MMSETMRALVRERYGGPDVLRVDEVRRPVPLDHEVLVRAHAVSLNLGDWELLTGEPAYIAVLATLFGVTTSIDRVEGRLEAAPPADGATPGWLRSPRQKILGADVSGRVAAVGASVTRFRPGDEVLGFCGFGGLAEYVRMRETDPLTRKPATLGFAEAAALPQATFIALRGIRDRGQVRAGQRVLVNGAGGGAGTLALQLARASGATVTAVDRGSKGDLLRRLGADRVVDYTTDDYTQTDERYDLILDLAAHRPVAEVRRLLVESGRYLLAGGALGPTLQALRLQAWTSMAGARRVSFLMAAERPDDLDDMLRYVEAGDVVPVVDRAVPLEEGPAAFARVGAGEALGKVIITLGDT